jgi:hypothetical protein
MSGRTPVNVHSFGSLYLFNKAKKPSQAGKATRCLECPYEADCAWSAKKIYVDGDMDHVRLGDPKHNALTNLAVDDKDYRRRRGTGY